MSLSINTNTSSMVALETLNATQTALSATENAVSTGKKVATAEDSPATFGIAAQMQGNIAGQSAVNDGLTFAAKVVSNADSAANNILSVLNNIQQAVTSLGNNSSSSTSVSQINDELKGFFDQIDSIAGGATINGVNLLTGAGSAANTITYAGLSPSGTSMVYVTGLAGQTSTLNGFGSMDNLSTQSSSAAKTGTTFSAMLGIAATTFISADGTKSSISATMTLASMISDVQTAIQDVTRFTSKLGASAKTIASLSSFGSTLSDNLTAGVGALTDADMSAESAKLTSLQTKQSLAIKSLTIANGQSQNILSLFQG
ncbi:MAG: flagellin [Acetobacter orientalis]|uniref:flagellin N-terminal helical domain-containing protein n=1 Tax=Acetobacter orientalis TaxID=146474 RepID=UPI0039ECC743